MLASAKATENLDDAALAQRIAAGDTVAMQLLMRRCNQSLYRAARSILKDDAEAEEALQDAYLHAFKAIGAYRGEARLSTWLTRIVVNEALGRSRKHKRRAEIIRFDDPLPDPSAAEDGSMQQDTVEAPETAAIRAEVRHLIERRIDDLPDIFRSVFVLRALEEMSVEETANCLGLPEATVRSRYFRARGLLREALARELDLNMESAFSFAAERCDRIVGNVLARVKSPADRQSPLR